MPAFFDDKDQVILGERAQARPEVGPAREVGFGETARAAFAEQNTIGSILQRGIDFESPLEPAAVQPEEEFDVFAGDYLNGFEDFADSFVGVTTRARGDRIKARIQQRLKNRETLAASGATGILAQMAAGVLDPVFLPFMFTPAGMATRVGQVSRTGNAMRMGAQGLAGAGASELILQATQETRPVSETALNVAGSVLVGGILGAASRRLNPKQRQDLEDLVEGEFAETLPGQSVGAAAVKGTTLPEETLVGAAGVEKAGRFITPALRMVQNSSLRARQIFQDAFRDPFFRQKNADGIPNAQAVETLIAQHDARVGTSHEFLQSAFVKYRKGREGGTAARLRISAGDLFGVRRGKDAPLTWRQFREAVGRAARRGDESPNPDVAAAAKFYRKTVFDPLLKEAQELGLLPEGVTPRTSQSYLTRIYNTEKIRAQREVWNTKLVKWVRSRNNELSEAEALDVVEEITENILGTPGGRIPTGIVPKASGLKERVLLIADEQIEEFLESDIDMIAAWHTRTMAPEIELTRRFGSTDMATQLDDIRLEYRQLIRDAKTDKAKIALQDELDQTIEDVTAMRDMLLGLHRASDAVTWATRTTRAVRTINFLRLLGGMTISAIPDLGRAVMTHGLRRNAKALGQMATSWKRFKVAARDVKLAGTAWDMVMNTRALQLADVGDLYRAGSRFERGLRAAQDTFGIPSLMAPWNAALKQWAGVITQTRMLEGIVNGTDIRKLAQLGLGDDMIARIRGQFQEFGDATEDVWLPMVDRWTDKEAGRAFRAALVKDVDNIIVTPGVADRPLFMSTELGKVAFQFKSFAFASTNQVLIAGLQQRDAAFFNGLLLSVGLGGVVYGAKQMLAGREIDVRPEKVILEAVDRSGVTGYWMDVNNMISTATSGTVSIGRIAGIDDPMSRYATRNVAGIFLGPTAGAVEDMARVLRAFGQLGNEEFRESDLHAIRKLIPYQNLFYTRKLFDIAEENMADALDLE